MQTDIRLLTTFPRHPKIRKLKMRLGAEAVLCLINLWLFARENRADGSLTGMDIEDLELAAEWRGEEGTLIAALVDLALLDRCEDGFTIHNWERNNPWAAGAEERSAKARKAAKVRWGSGDKKRQRNTENGTSDAPSINTDAPSIKNDALSTFEQCPSPFLSNTVDSTSFEESTNTEQSTSYQLSSSTSGREEDSQNAAAPPEGAEGMGVVARLHFSLFAYPLKGGELDFLRSYPLEQVLAKYQEAAERKGTASEVRSWRWIEEGLKGGRDGGKQGFFKRMFGGVENDRARGFRVDHG